MLLDDGKGRGYKAEITNNNKVRAYATTEKEISYESEVNGEAYTWTAVSANVDTGDTGLLVCNDSATKKLIIQKIYVWADVAAQFKVHVPAYPTLAGTAVVGVNLNRASNNVADATAKADETGNTFAAANVITTLRNTYYSRGNGDDNADIPAAGQGQWVDYDGALVLGYHDCIAVDIIGESAAFECTIIGYFHSV